MFLDYLLKILMNSVKPCFIFFPTEMKMVHLLHFAWQFFGLSNILCNRI